MVAEPEFLSGCLTAAEAKRLAEESVWTLAKSEVYLVLERIREEAVKGNYQGRFVVSYRYYPHIRALLGQLGYSVDQSSSSPGEDEESIVVSWKG